MITTDRLMPVDAAQLSQLPFLIAAGERLRLAWEKGFAVWLSSQTAQEFLEALDRIEKFGPPVEQGEGQ